MTKDDDTGDSPTLVKKGSIGDGSAASAFLRAARSGNLQKVLEFLAANFDINTSNNSGLNALHLSSKEGFIAVVRELLKRGAGVDSATKKGNTALHVASLAGHLDVVHLLVQHGANVNAQSQNGFTALYMAAQENHVEIVKFLLASGANQTLATDDGFTPLAVALQQSNESVVRVLLDNDARGKMRLPALHIAAKKDDVRAAAMILQAGFSTMPVASDSDADQQPSTSAVAEATPSEAGLSNTSTTVSKTQDLVNETTKSLFTPLHIAAHYGNANVAKLLLEHGADISFPARNSITPLHVAAKWGRLNMVRLLVESGALVDSRTNDGLTPLHCAARSGHATVVEYLIGCSCQVDVKTKNGLTALHMAAQGDQVESAKLLLNHGVLVDDVTVDSLTALHVAAHCGNLRIAKMLLDRGCNVNSRAMNGFTPLHVACKKNRLKMVELLLKHGAVIDSTTESGLTSLHVAAFMGYRNVMLYLMQHGAASNACNARGERPLHLAVRAGQLECARALLRQGAEVDARAREQQTALHLAARLGNADLCVVLLQHGANPDAVTGEKYTPLHVAAKHGHEDAAAVLLEHGARTELASRKQFTPLHLCAKYGRAGVARLLVARKCNVDMPGRNGLTPLHVAVHYRQTTVVDLLLDARASTQASAKNGFAPLHIAVKKGDATVVQLLLDHSAKPNADSKCGFTPLHVACQEGFASIAGQLVRGGANVNARSKNSLTPMHLCAQNDCVGAAVALSGGGADINAQTKAGFTPLHTASHFGSLNMVNFLLERGARKDERTADRYTPLTIAAHRGHRDVVHALLEHGADVNALTIAEQSALSIATSLGHMQVVELLRAVTTVQTAHLDEQPTQLSPEVMQEQALTDSEDEGDSELASRSGSLRRNEMSLHISEFAGSLDAELAVLAAKKADESLGGTERESTFQFQLSAGDMDYTRDTAASLADDLVDGAQIELAAAENQESGEQVQVAKRVHDVQAEVLRSPATNVSVYDQSTKLPLLSESPKPIVLDGQQLEQPKGFLVSFMVDARGGVLWGTRFPGFRVIIPPRAAPQPTRITCRLLRRERMTTKPPLNAAEGLAFRLIEMGPTNLKFNRPIAIEVPHMASLADSWREITVLRSENGETWKEHSYNLTPGVAFNDADKVAVRDMLLEAVDRVDSDSELRERNVHRIVTSEFPMYFALITRVRVQIEQFGSEGGMLNSVVVPNVQSVYPEGALQKRIRIGLQTLPLSTELVQRVSGSTRVSCSPVVTIEPRRRKFHKPITLTIPMEKPIPQSSLSQSAVEVQSLRLLCSITAETTGGAAPVQWEDITGSTQLTVSKNCVTFTTTVSARFWLIDTPAPVEVVDLATRLYREACLVPYLARFVVYSKGSDEPLEAKLRCFCVTDDKPEKTLELQDGFTEIARSAPTVVLDTRPHFYEVGGNLQALDVAPGESPSFNVFAFRENRQAVAVRVRDPAAPASGHLSLFREPYALANSKVEPFCVLNFDLPHEGALPQRSLAIGVDEELYKAKLKLNDVSKYIGSDWLKLGRELGVAESELQQCNDHSTDAERALEALLIWQYTRGPKATGNELGAALERIGRADVITSCAHDEQLVRDARERALAKQHADGVNGTANGGLHDEPLVPLKSTHGRAEDRERRNAQEKAQVDQKNRVDAMKDIAALLDSAITEPSEHKLVKEPNDTDTANEQVERTDAKKPPKTVDKADIDLDAFALPAVQAPPQPARSLTDDQNETASRHARYGSTEEKRKTNDAIRNAVSSEEKLQALDDLTALLVTQLPAEDCLHPHTTAEQHRAQPDEAEEHVEATRKQDVKAAAPKSNIKPREAAPDEDVEEREVQSTAKAAHASPGNLQPLVPDTSVEQEADEKDTIANPGNFLPFVSDTSVALERSEKEDTIAKVDSQQPVRTERYAMPDLAVDAIEQHAVDLPATSSQSCCAQLDETEPVCFNQPMVSRATFRVAMEVSSLKAAEEIQTQVQASHLHSTTVEDAQMRVSTVQPHCADHVPHAVLSPLPVQAIGDQLQEARSALTENCVTPVCLAKTDVQAIEHAVVVYLQPTEWLAAQTVGVGDELAGAIEHAQPVMTGLSAATVPAGAAEEGKHEAPGRFQLLLAPEERERIAEKLDSPVQSPDDALKPFFQSGVSALSQIEESDEIYANKSIISASATAPKVDLLAAQDSCTATTSSAVLEKHMVGVYVTTSAISENVLAVDHGEDAVTRQLDQINVAPENRKPHNFALLLDGAPLEDERAEKDISCRPSVLQLSSNTAASVVTVNVIERVSPYENLDSFIIPPTVIEEEEEEMDADDDPEMAAQYAALQREYQLTADQTFAALMQPSLRTGSPGQRLTGAPIGSSISSSLAEFEKLETEMAAGVQPRGSASSVGSGNAQPEWSSGSNELEPEMRRARSAVSEPCSRSSVNPGVPESSTQCPDQKQPAESQQSPTHEAEHLPSARTLPTSQTASFDSADMAASTDSLSVSSSSHTTVMNQSAFSIRSASFPTDCDMCDSGMRQSTDDFTATLSVARLPDASEQDVQSIDQHADLHSTSAAADLSPSADSQLHQDEST